MILSNKGELLLKARINWQDFVIFLESAETNYLAQMLSFGAFYTKRPLC